LAADNVDEVDLTVNGASVPVSLRNNSVFAELPFGAAEATVTIHYSDADDQTMSVNLTG
jgi:hypothetical protein